MNKLIHWALRMTITISVIGCAGGSQGTGVRIDKQLVDGPVKTDIPNYKSMFSLSSLFSESCDISKGDFSSEVTLSTEFGESKVSKDTNSNCLFEVPLQAYQRRVTLSNWIEGSQKITYKIIEVNCSNRNEEKVIYNSTDTLASRSFSLPNFKFQNSKTYKLIINSPEASQSPILLRLVSDAEGSCN